MKFKALFFALVAALAIVCTAVSCQKEVRGVYGCTTQGDCSEYVGTLAHDMHSAVQTAVGSVSVRSGANDSKAINAAQQVIDKRENYSLTGTIILYFAPSTQIGEPDAEKIPIKTWQF